MTKSCGTCSLCCKLPAIAALGKPAGQWCVHARPGQGCGIHGTHPAECQAFRCGWLQAEDLGEEWKPTACRFILRIGGPGGQIGISLDPDHPEAWKKAPYYQAIKSWSARAAVFVYLGNRTTAVFPQDEVECGDTDRGDVIRLGFRQAGPLTQAWVRVEPAEGKPKEYLGAWRTKA